MTRRPLLNAQSVFRLGVGTSLGGLALWLTFRNVDLGLVLASIERMHVSWVVAALVIVAATVTASARRWQLLVYRAERPRDLPQFIAATVVGQMLNVLLPIRLGEAARAYWISRTERQPLSRILGTIVVERLPDVVMLGISVGLLLFSVSLPAWARSSGRLTLAASAVVIMIAVAIGKWGGSVLRAFEVPLRLFPETVRSFLLRQARIALAELRAFSDWRANARIWLLSVAILSLAVGTNYLLFWAFDLRLPLMTALLLFVVLQIGGAPVSTPGNLGIFHYLVVLVLTATGVDRTAAVAYAIVLHAVALGPKIVAGALILAVVRTPALENGLWNYAVLKVARGSGG